VSELRLRNRETTFAVQARPHGERTAFTLRRSVGESAPIEVAFELEIQRRGAGEFIVAGPAGPRRGYVVRHGDLVWVEFAGSIQRFEIERGVARRRGTAGHDEIAAPMPGQVLRVLVAAGDLVEKGQTLLVVEAMKMQIELAAPHAGTVLSIAVAAGDKVLPGVPLVEIDALAAAPTVAIP
jgi:3-methylcrotonyl-CoA carboxylase alpha subunit